METSKFRIDLPTEAVQWHKLRKECLQACVSMGLTAPLCWDLVAAADEIATNVMEHSGAHWVEWDMRVDRHAGHVTLSFRDDGASYDALEAMDDAESAAGDGTKKHLGFLLVKQVAKALSYRRLKSGENELTLVASAA